LNYANDLSPALPSTNHLIRTDVLNACFFSSLSDGDPAGRSRKQKIECDTEIGKVVCTGRAGVFSPLCPAIVKRRRLASILNISPI